MHEYVLLKVFVFFLTTKKAKFVVAFRAKSKNLKVQQQSAGTEIRSIFSALHI